MSTKHLVARDLAAAFLAGNWSPEELLCRGALACGRRERWLRPLIRRVITSFDGPRRTREALASFIDADAGFNRAWERHCEERRFTPRQVFWGGTAPAMWPAAGAPASWLVPALTTPAALADWLGLQPTELEWFADCHGHEADVDPGALRHYTYRWLPKASGKWRLLEMPKARLKSIQRRALHELLDRIPPHEAAHGYRRGRSIATFAAPHCGRRIVLRFDLRDFFPSVSNSRVHAL
jgi:RNA-directed DNA polymerase